MNAWAERHRAALEAVVEEGETLRAAERVIVAGKRRRAQLRDVPRSGFVLVVTDRRLVAVGRSRWLARPGTPLASWLYTDGYALGRPTLFGRVPLVLPDRRVVSLAPFGGRSIRCLAATD